MIDLSEIIFVLVCLSYFVNTFIFYYFAVEKIRMIEMIALSNPRKRTEIEAIKNDTKKDIILCFFWPIIFLREITNALKNKK